MQTVLVVASPTAGVVYLGGRFAGEVDDGRPLTTLVSPFGPLFLEFRPFGSGYLPLTLRLTLSKGRLTLSGDEPDGRYFAAIWPGGTIELELMPERAEQPVFRPISEASGVYISCAIGRKSCVRCEREGEIYIHPLPEGAAPPVCMSLPDGILLSGAFSDGNEYALILAPDGSAVRLCLNGRDLTLPDDGHAVRMFCPAGDTVGHAWLETWSPSGEEWRRVSAEPMWEKGAPAWPETPEATALAALETAQLGLMQEAASYFAPAVSCMEALEQAAQFDGCASLRHPLPDGCPAVGLTRMEKGVLHITPVRYVASPGGAHGFWQLTKLKVGDCT